jgi:hypothetical protein
MRRLTLAVFALLPVAAVAQGLTLRSPSVGEAMQQLDRLEGKNDAPLEQTFILPERPGQNQVAWYDFDWHHYDVPPPGGGPGGIRLYYYQSAKAQAQRALPAILSAYARLVDQFHYNPTKQIPYILYSTQREFQTTNVFQVSEGTLGVTSPQDLKMTVPYFGDHWKFVETSTHEMVHQFTIQKLLEAAGTDEMTSPISFLPLWFIEGIAEYYTKGGIDVETDLYLRDLVWNPDPRRGYEILPFPEDRIRGFIPTYKLGQARIAFIAEVYGPDKIQGFLESAYLLGDGSQSAGAGARNFGALVRRVLNEPIEQVDARWQSWVKKRYYREYLDTKQDLAQMRLMRSLPAEPESFVTSEDGNLVFLRGIDRDKGRAKLFLFDVRHVRGAVPVAQDSEPGMEWLHPIEYNTLAIGKGIIAFSAQDGPGDRLYYRRFRHKEPEERRAPSIELGKLRRLDVHAPGGGRFTIIADPSFSADASHIAFVGVALGDGQSDIYVVPVTGGEARRVTDDPFVERDLAWGPDGIYCSSDATDHGRLNLFRIDPGTGSRTRLTTAPATDRSPQPQADGSVLYTSDAHGKPDIHLLKNGKTQRLTDFTTGLTSPAASPKARGIFATTFHGGEFRLIEVPKVAWLEEEPVAIAPAAGAVLQIPEAEIPEQTPEYDALALRNWRPQAGFVYGGGAGASVAGRASVLFSDYLRDHVLFMDLSVYGSFEYTQALVLYENRAQRTPKLYGAFHFVQPQLDRLDPDLAYYQRDFGVVTAVRHPLDRFRRLEAEVMLGAVQRYCLTDLNSPLVCGGIRQNSPVYGDSAGWEERNGGVNPLIQPTLRYGYDTMRFDPATGPVDGSSLLLEVGGAYLPTQSAVTGFVRADAQRFWRLAGRSNFSLRFAGGSSFAPNERSEAWEKSFWLTAADNLRGFYPLDNSWLIGQGYYVMNAELQVPLDPLIRLFIFDYIEGVAALDFGGVFDQWKSGEVQPVEDPANGDDPPDQFNDFEDRLFNLGAWDSRTLTGVLGVNVLFGPLLLRVHFGHPFDIGGLPTPALVRNDNWVTNVTLRYFFF